MRARQLVFLLLAWPALGPVPAAAGLKFFSKARCRLVELARGLESLQLDQDTLGQLERQETIFRSEKQFMIRQRGLFKRPDAKSEITRVSSSYEEALGPRFMASLKALGPNDNWIDGGGGSAAWAQEYFDGATIPDKANVISITYGDPGRSPEQQARFEKFATAHHLKFRELLGRYLEDIPSSELPKAQLISDVFGPFAYSARVDDVLRKYGELLAPGGRAFIAFPGHPKLFIEKNGALYKLDEFWLGKIKGMSFEVMPPDKYGTAVLMLTRTHEALDVPTLRLKSYTVGTPPRRVYVEAP